ncbi:MAG: 3-phosphoshikimate 1-carboxyvinyltransferase [Lachnospiraceae bacterium]|nr:3-phosphoshikimate 1-carboxyvinyltransferase [Lachnospiraceae bacterium]
MNITIKPGERSGCVTIPSSKSQAHRQLICAALSKSPSVIFCDGISKDIKATIDCLNAAGADISFDENGRIEVRPLKADKNAEGKTADLYCGESGSTLRFMIPVAGALGLKAVFHMEGRLADRPIQVYTDELSRHGMRFVKEGSLLKCEGRLESGDYTIPGNISSQYITGLLFALPLLEGSSSINITGSLESADYIAMTEDALKISGVEFEKGEMRYDIKGGQKYAFPSEVKTEGDWSNAAFFICMGALSEDGICIKGLNNDSSQGDRRILELAEAFGAETMAVENEIWIRRGNLSGQTIDAREIPDLVPTISALASVCKGTTRIINAGRLRLKESDRLTATRTMLAALGADVEETDDGLIINGRERLGGGTVSSFNDHRIAMAAAVAASACVNDVTVEEAQCTAKSYPGFWKDYESLEIKSSE